MEQEITKINNREPGIGPTTKLSQKSIKTILSNNKVNIYILIFLIILYFTIRFLSFGETKIESDLNNIYYFFSTSAQVIGAFIAFILAGYIFIHQFLDSRQDKDDSLVDIHNKLKSNYYLGFRNLSICTFIALILDLLVLLINDFDQTYPIHVKLVQLVSSYKYEIMTITAVINIATIFGAMLLVVYIINPRTYDNALKTLIKETQHKYHERLVSRSDFFNGFVDLESSIREFVSFNKNVVIKSRFNNRENSSFKEMIDGLYYSGFIDGSLYEEFLEINKIRNLVFHGKMKEVDIGIVNAVKTLQDHFDKIKVNVKPKY